MKKYGTHGDGVESLNVGDTVSTSDGKEGYIANVVIGGSEPKYVVTFPDGISNVYTRFNLTLSHR